MPIRLPENLPAFETLKSEGVNVLGEKAAERQDIRPLRFALLNLMPLKITTETQFARLIGATPIQIDLHLLRMSDHVSKNTDLAHLDSFYRPVSEVFDERFDGLIVTGAPIEHLAYHDVTYWAELEKVFEWTSTHVHSSMNVCWGGMAALKYFYGIEKQILSEKLFGCYRHQNIEPTSPIMRGLSDDFLVPVSRWTEILREDILNAKALNLLVDSHDSGPCLIEDKINRRFFNLNHLEYDSVTLKNEYDRDIAEGQSINIPRNYFPDDDPNQEPVNRWKSSAHILYTNWVSEIYQSTPFEINKIGKEVHSHI